MKKAFHILSIFLLVLCSLELASHAFFYLKLGYPVWGELMRANYLARSSLSVTHPYLPYLRKDHPGILHGTNTDGFRGEQPNLDDTEEIRILCVGGSTTVDQPDFYKSWPGLLQTKLRTHFKNKKIKVLVQAHGAWMSSENLVMLTLRSLDLKPDLVVFYEGYNDLIAGSSPGFRSDYSHSRPRLAKGPAEHVALSLARFRDTHPSLHYSGLLGALTIIGFGGDVLAFNRSMFAVTGHPLNGFHGFPTFARNMNSMITLAHDHGARVALIGFNHFVDGPGDRDTMMYHYAVQEMNRITEDLANHTQGSSFMKPDFIPYDTAHFTDPVHFTPKGSHAMAEKIGGFLQHAGLVANAEYKSPTSLEVIPLWNEIATAPGSSSNGIERRDILFVPGITKGEPALLVTPGNEPQGLTFSIGTSSGFTIGEVEFGYVVMKNGSVQLDIEITSSATGSSETISIKKWSRITEQLNENLYAKEKIVFPINPQSTQKLQVRMSSQAVAGKGAAETYFTYPVARLFRGKEETSSR